MVCYISFIHSFFFSPLAPLVAGRFCFFLLCLHCLHCLLVQRTFHRPVLFHFISLFCDTTVCNCTLGPRISVNMFFFLGLSFVAFGSLLLL